ncbi:HAMP domain-containing protein [Aceticella autotrophica]|uniref:histidine kinase n=1 Tax=Aceticella autotrophica TaxID=2755338 RepID=A0A975AVB0_9THEO|nr:HAMP domain-containing protein [Aceticella autotrophica]
MTLQILNISIQKEGLVIISVKKDKFKSIKWFQTLQWKIILIYGLLVLVAMGIIWVYLYNSLESYHMKNFDSYIQAQVKGMSCTLKDNLESNKNLNNIISMYLGPNSNIKYVYILDKNGNILASSTGDKGKFLTTAVVKALHGNKSSETTKDYNSNEELKSFAVPVVNSDGSISGVVYMSGSLNSVYDVLSDINMILLSATLFAVFVTVILGYFLSCAITNPIKEVTKYAHEMALGNFDVKINIKSRDEIGNLGSMFNFMSQRLKHTLDEMKNEKSKVEAIISFMTDGVIAVDSKKDIILYNDAAEKMIGEKLGIGQSVENLANGKISINGGTFLCNEKILTSFVTPINADENIEGYVFVLHDITEQQELENMRKEFVANVSHELRTPLTTIKSYTETLLNADVDKAFIDKFLGIIDKEVDRMVRLVKDLLLLSRMDSNGKLKLESVNLNKFVEDIIQNLKIEMEKKNQILSLSLKDAKKNVNIDKDKMEQVIINIVANAIKYTPEGGCIRVYTDYDEEAAYIIVQDNGIGIPEKDLSRIFERFYRVDKGRSRELGGTGLGLSIAKEIVEAHKGEINIESEIDKGTVVKIILKYN